MTRWLALLLCLFACDDPEPVEAPAEEDSSELGWIQLHDPGSEPRRRTELRFEVRR
jgi:hypothetical protein